MLPDLTQPATMPQPRESVRPINGLAKLKQHRGKMNKHRESQFRMPVTLRAELSKKHLRVDCVITSYEASQALEGVET